MKLRLVMTKCAGYICEKYTCITHDEAEHVSCLARQHVTNACKMVLRGLKAAFEGKHSQVDKKSSEVMITSTTTEQERIDVIQLYGINKESGVFNGK